VRCGTAAAALRVAFGEAEGDRLDPFLVALGTLSLLTELVRLDRCCAWSTTCSG
jgi:hypothetical protein